MRECVGGMFEISSEVVKSNGGLTDIRREKEVKLDISYIYALWTFRAIVG